MCSFQHRLNQFLRSRPDLQADFVVKLHLTSNEIYLFACLMTPRATREILYQYYEVREVQILVDTMKEIETEKYGSLDPFIYICDI